MQLSPLPASHNKTPFLPLYPVSVAGFKALYEEWLYNGLETGLTDDEFSEWCMEASSEFLPFDTWEKFCMRHGTA